MASLRSRKNFSSPSLQSLLPPPIPTGKGSRSAAVDPAFTEYIDNTKQIPELFLPDHHFPDHSEEPDDDDDVIDYELLLLGDKESVNRLLRLKEDYSGAVQFQISDHGISCEELISILSENQRVFERLGQTRRYSAHHEDIIWCHDIVEEVYTTFPHHNLHLFSQNMNKVGLKLKRIAEELASIIEREGIMQLKNRIQTSESTLVLHRYHYSTDITDQLLFPTTPSSQEISSDYTLSLHLLLDPSSFTSQNILVFIDEGQRGSEFKNTIENLQLRPELEQFGPLFSIELRYSSNPNSSAFDLSNLTKKFSLADQILILLLLAFLYYAYCFLFS